MRFPIFRGLHQFLRELSLCLFLDLLKWRPPARQAHENLKLTHGCGGTNLFCKACVLDKTRFRKIAKEKRDTYIKSLSDVQISSFEDAAIWKLLELIPQNCNIGAYWSICSEFPTHRIVSYFHTKGYQVLLPAFNINQNIFRVWEGEDVMQEGDFGISIPKDTCPVASPDVVLVPMLGFDLKCNRIGYGKGYYDKVLKTYRDERNILAIGLGYDMQESKDVPIEPHDQAMDIILTETRIIQR